jgi:hypothetical protein
MATTDAGTVLLPLGSTATIPPSPSNLARWNNGLNGGISFLQTRPTGVEYLLLMAHLQNDAGGPLNTIKVSYDYSTASGVVTEDIKGLRAFWSFSGAPGSWTLIPALSVETSAPLEFPETLTATITLSAPLVTGGTLFLLWADPNSLGTDASWHITNFSASAGDCSIVGTVSGLQRNPGLNAADPSDDTITFAAAFTGTGGVSPAGWIVTAPAFLAGASGAYGTVPAVFSVPVSIFNAGPLELKVADAAIVNCKTSVIVSIPGADSDGDGIGDADEVIMGTNPANPSDVLRLWFHSGNPAQLEFPSKVGRFYRLYTSGDLRTWTDSGIATIAGDGGPKLFAASTAVPGRQFYRLQVKTTDGPWSDALP